MTIVYPNATVTTVVVVTDGSNNGYYSFGNLLLDEDFNGVGGPEPTHTITVDGTQPVLFGYFVTVINAPSATLCTNSATVKCNDSNNPAGTAAQPFEGQTNTTFANDTVTISSYDFGYALIPTSVSLDYFEAEVQGRNVQLDWATLNEADLLGFDVYRAQSQTGPWTKLNATLIAAQNPGSTQGNVYQWIDRNVPNGRYWYRLDWMEITGPQTAAYAEVQVGNAHAQDVDADGHQVTVTSEGASGSVRTRKRPRVRQSILLF